MSVSGYEKMIFESASVHRYGGETWARVLLACGCIDPDHIQAINMEIARRIQEGENREPDEEDRPVNDDAMRQRGPKVVLDHRFGKDFNLKSFSYLIIYYSLYDTIFRAYWFVDS